MDKYGDRVSSVYRHLIGIGLLGMGGLLFPAFMQQGFPNYKPSDLGQEHIDSIARLGGVVAALSFYFIRVFSLFVRDTAEFHDGSKGGKKSSP